MEEIPFLFFVVFGFLAQIIDGAIGMGYGASCSSMMLSFGIPPAMASASVHTAEVFTTGISGLSHGIHGNIKWDLLKRLIIPGVIGAVVGAYILTEVDGDTIKPFIAIYLAATGLLILWKARRRFAQKEDHCKVVPCALVGGFLDAVGGGGWGAIVTSNLVARGNHPRFTIGSANAAEFFVSLSQSIVFLLTIGLSHWHMTLGLLLGGAAAAPLAARFCQRLPARALMVMVGVVVIALSIRTMANAWF